MGLIVVGLELGDVSQHVSVALQLEKVTQCFCRRVLLVQTELLAHRCEERHETDRAHVASSRVKIRGKHQRIIACVLGAVSCHSEVQSSAICNALQAPCNKDRSDCAIIDILAAPP